MPGQDSIRRLAGMIKDSGNTVFFGGAGVSTESGIPDFRSESGLYRARQVYGHAPEELLSREVFLREPELFFRYYKENLIAPDARPNAAHTALAGLEAKGLLAAVVTQNIDSLHTMAGSKTVLELHGSNARQFCVDCGEKYNLAYILDPENCGGHIPKCRKCGGVVRPDVVLYGEGLDGAVLKASVGAIARAELLIVGGTSLAVHPAAGLLWHFTGKNLVVINKTETPRDEYAQLVIHAGIGEVLGKAVNTI